MTHVPTAHLPLKKALAEYRREVARQCKKHKGPPTKREAQRLNNAVSEVAVGVLTVFEREPAVFHAAVAIVHHFNPELTPVLVKACAMADCFAPLPTLSDRSFCDRCRSEMQ